ncbi:MAG: DUF1552 domain-containing protein [Fuerstiella sp.]|jgi:hypothetical protein|nr:DUF1552 domain-containing protein [Fuerstiella sp.]
MRRLQTAHRRSFLKASGVSVALPMLESLAAADTTPDNTARRLVCIGGYLGFHQKSIYPQQVGRDYEISPLLRPIAEHRNDFTIFSGLDHRAPNGHGAWSNYLCGQDPAAVSLDQIVAEHIGQNSRFPSVQLTAGKASRSMSYTRQGIALPMIQRPSVFYRMLFASADDRAHTEYLLKSGRSALDLVLTDAQRLRANVSGRDAEKLSEYFDSVRDVEKRMARQLKGIDNPIPQTDYRLPNYDPVAPNLMLEAETLMYDLMALALQTDSTRVATMFLAGLGQVFTIDGETLQAGYHALSHHGNDPDKVRDLVKVELEHMKCFNRFLNQLKTKTDAHGRPLLDSTVVMMGTGMGDASRHANDNLPTIVAGGGFRHGQHLAIDREQPTTPLLGDLFITMMQRLGLEEDHFSNANQNLNHLFS